MFFLEHIGLSFCCFFFHNIHNLFPHFHERGIYSWTGSNPASHVVSYKIIFASPAFSRILAKASLINFVISLYHTRICPANNIELLNSQTRRCFHVFRLSCRSRAKYRFEVNFSILFIYLFTTTCIFRSLDLDLAPSASASKFV